MKSFNTIFLLFFPIAVFAQCCPYIDELTFIPETPQDGDSLFLKTVVTTPNQGEYLGYQLTETGNEIDIEACYYNGLATALQTYTDTIPLGVFGEGQINVTFTAQQTESQNECIPTDSQSVDVFVTINPLSLAEESIAPLLFLQNRVRDQLLSFQGESWSQLKIVNLSGQLIHQTSLDRGDVHHIDLPIVDKGTYLALFLHESGWRIAERIFVE